MDYVFVYGTLKSQYGNSRLLTGATLVGAATTEQSDYTLVDLGGFPAVHMDGETAIKGELYTDLSDDIRRSLDWLEGYPDFYNRTQVDVRTEFGELIKSWMYFFEGDPTYPVVDSGEWHRGSNV